MFKKSVFVYVRERCRSEVVYCVHPRSFPAVCFNRDDLINETGQKQRMASLQEMTKVVLLDYGRGMQITFSRQKPCLFRVGNKTDMAALLFFSIGNERIVIFMT